MKKRCGGYCDKNRFYNLLYLLDCELTEIGYGLDIPCYWYQDRVMVKDAENLFYLRKRDLFDILPQDEKNDMDKALEQFLKEHKSKTNKQLHGELFKEAPFPFQNEFRKFLMSVGGWREKPTLDDYFDYGNSDTLYSFKKLIKTFPQKEFEDLYPLFLEWEKCTKYIVKHEKSLEILRTFYWSFQENYPEYYNDEITQLRIRTKVRELLVEFSTLTRFENLKE